MLRQMWSEPVLLCHATEQVVIGCRKEDYIKISNVKADTGWKQISVQILDFQSPERLNS